MKIDRTEIDGVTHLRFSGSMDLENYPLMKQTIAELSEGDIRRVIVNLQAVDIISSSGIGALVHLARELERQEGRLVLAAPSKMVAEVLELLQLTNYFRIRASDEEALAEFSA